jgi:hypothetical protein
VDAPFVQKPDAAGIGRAFERPPTQDLDATEHRRAVRAILHQGNRCEIVRVSTNLRSAPAEPAAAGGVPGAADAALPLRVVEQSTAPLLGEEHHLVLHPVLLS